jgi:hypothetical protein
VRPCDRALFYNIAEEAARERLLQRGKTSGRVDDNEETIRNRFVVFKCVLEYTWGLIRTLLVIDTRMGVGSMCCHTSSLPFHPTGCAQRPSVGQAFSVVLWQRCQ